MGKGCSRPRVQGFEIFEESPSFRTAPEGKPAEEPCIEGTPTETNAQYYALYQREPSKNVSIGKPFSSECNLIVSLPSGSTANGIDSACHQSSDTRPTMQSQATQTPPTDPTVKKDNRQEIGNISPRGYNDMPVNEMEYRRTKKKRRRRLQQHPTESGLCGSDPDLISAYIKKRLELIALEGDRFLGKSEPQVQHQSDEQTIRKMRPRRRHSLVDKNNLADDLPARDVTYPGACVPPDDVNDINSLIVEPGSECSTQLWLPCRDGKIHRAGYVEKHERQNSHHHIENATRCPCVHKHSTPRNTELKLNSHEEPHDTPRNRRTRRRKPKPTDGNRNDRCYSNNDAKTAHTIKIDRSCLCDRDNNDDGIDYLGCCRREIIMRHEHHHYHHYPKSRSKTNRRHTFRI